MLKLSFDQRWVNLIMMCVTTVRYSVLVNDQKVEPITLGSGSRQGDLLSLYLFLFCAEGLTALIRMLGGEG